MSCPDLLIFYCNVTPHSNNCFKSIYYKVEDCQLIIKNEFQGPLEKRHTGVDQEIDQYAQNQQHQGFVQGCH